MADLQSYKAVLGDRRDWVRAFMAATAGGLFFGLAGPFGNYLLGPLSVRVAYWVGAIWIGVPVFGLTDRLIAHLAARWQVPRALLLAPAALLAVLPVAALSHMAAVALWGRPIAAIGFARWYGQSLLVAAPFVVGFAAFLATRPAPKAHVDDEVVVPPAGGFLARIPAGLGRDLVALQMEDHYVRAHTRLGSALILMPLHRAIEELGDVPGLRIHRSWWVALGAVASTVRDGRNIRLRLITGLEAPVARASVALARAQGLLD